MRDWISAALLVGGGSLMLLAAVGIVRLPDLFTRMHAATKPATLGTALTMLAVAVHFGELGVTTRALLVVVFFVITAPVGAHMIGRAAYLAGVPLWEGTILDERRHRGDGRPRPPDEGLRRATRHPPAPGDPAGSDSIGGGRDR